MQILLQSAAKLYHCLKKMSTQGKPLRVDFHISITIISIDTSRVGISRLYITFNLMCMILSKPHATIDINSTYPQ